VHLSTWVPHQMAGVASGHWTVARRHAGGCLNSSSNPRPLHAEPVGHNGRSRSADELVGVAGRFRETTTDGAGQDDLLRGAQVDQVTDTVEDRSDAVLRAQHAAALGASQGWHAADHLDVVNERRDRAAAGRERLP
jgi:hypothetical protein